MLIPNMAAFSTKEYKNPSVTVDAIVTRQKLLKHEILLIERLNEPYKGKLAFPGGFVDYGEDPQVACLRELQEECSVEMTDEMKLELITVAGAPNRDPRKQIISIVYAVLNVSPDIEIKAADDAASAYWYDIQSLLQSDDDIDSKMAFDHDEILKTYLRKHLP